MRISDWSSDVCSSDLLAILITDFRLSFTSQEQTARDQPARFCGLLWRRTAKACMYSRPPILYVSMSAYASTACRSEEHTSELQSLMRISYAVFCLKKKK